MAEATHIPKELGTVQKQPARPSQKTFPPGTPNLFCQPKLFLNKQFLWSSNGMPSSLDRNRRPRETGLLLTENNEENYENNLCNKDCYCIQLLKFTGWF